ncbi:MAG TPA: hypothetical protein VGP92_13965 [Acidimicrobiia bacterium]|jgi:hypothetical protein|nr:hypothetical protein [Acidimicrobiia bacterium]
MSRAFRVLSALATVGVVTSLTACGGGSSKPSASPTTSAATTTTSAAPATAPVTDPTASKAAIARADVGAGFADYKKASGFTAVGRESCSVTVPGSVLTAQDHVYAGPMFKKTDGTFFVYSEAYVFRSRALAQRYAAVRATTAFKKCKEKQDDAATRAAQPKNYVKLTTATFADSNGGIPTMYRELQGGPDATGKLTDVVFYDRYTVLHGRVVVVVLIDAALPKDNAGSQAIVTRTSTLLKSVSTALDKRVG